MTDPYYLDLEQFSLEQFRHSLETRDLLPGRKILQENLAERFEILETMGIHNLQTLIDRLKTRQKVKQFSQESGLPEAYLTILRREANTI